MREFFELINEYPWTTVFLVIGIGYLIEIIGDAIGTIIHGKFITEENKND